MLSILFAAALAPLAWGSAIPALEPRDAPPRLDFLTFTGCDAGKEAALRQAYTDAVVNFGRAVGQFPQLDWDNDKDIADYFGRKGSDRVQVEQRIVDTIQRIYDPSQANPGQTLQMRCDDIGDFEGSNCLQKRGVKRQFPTIAYTVNYGEGPTGKQDPAFINFCDPFFTLVTFAERYKNIDDERKLASEGGTFSMDDVRSFRNTQPQAMLHEFFHLEYRRDKSFRPQVGITSPRALDRSIRGKPGLAYGPERAKYLARAELGGPEAATSNDDNFGYFLISKYMTKTFGNNRSPAFTANKPKYSWPNAVAKRDAPPEAFNDDEWEASDDDLPEQMPDFAIVADDATFYGGTQSQASIIPIPTCYGTPAGPATDQRYAQSTIATYCAALESRNVSMSCETPYAPIGYAATSTDKSNSLWMSIQWDEDSCQGLGPYAIGKDTCNFYMSVLLNGCNTNSNTKKYGGNLERNCLKYNLQVVTGTSSIPPLGLAAEDPNCKAPMP